MRVPLLCGFVLAGVLQAQTQPAAAVPPTQDQATQGSPIYRVRVVGRTTKAVNYRRGGAPTPIDFQGTVLLPDAKGSAWVKANKGSTQIKARFKKLPPPTRFGYEYLTYVLWAITPEGRATNLGEILTDNDDEGKLNVSSDLQAFAMIVTAEPYFSVTQPSDVVVMENAVRKDTIGRVELVDAKFELLKRGEYSYDATAAQNSAGRGEKLPMHRYESLLAIYQAQNAVQIAQSLGADRHAAESLGKAQRLLQVAQHYYDNKADSKTIIQTARQAAQTAEDARLITIERQERETAADARAAAEQPAPAVSQ